MIFLASRRRSWSFARATRFSKEVTALDGVIRKYEGVLDMEALGEDVPALDSAIINLCGLFNQTVG
jgi:hypothetical protein